MKILGVELPNKRLVIALTYVYGIGRSRAELICKHLKLDVSKRANDLTNDDASAIQAFIQEQKWMLQNDLTKYNTDNILRLIHLKTYAGMRHRESLPVRGQRTKTNASTQKMKKKKSSGGK
jgi:small subunit ribosomal protein S13